MTKKNAALSIIFILLSSHIIGQNSNLGSWYGFFGSKKLNSKFNWHHEVQYRNYNFIGDLEQLLLRTGIGYNLSAKNNNLLLGYGHISSKNYDSANVFSRSTEHRVFQQFITKQKFKGITLQHRYRIEQQFLESNFNLRFRYFLSSNIGLKKLKMPAIYISAYNEIFISASNNPFNRKRIYGGLGYKINDHLKCELGYMNQLFRNYSRDQLNILLFANF